MRASRGEPVEVWLRHGKPERFAWRGRIYTVLLVLGQPAGECWLVEATPQRAVPPSVFVLCHDAGSGRWSLSRR